MRQSEKAAPRADYKRGAASWTRMEESRANLYCHREAAAWAPKPRELPVTLVTGFLGAGKTSLLRHILSNKSNLRVAAAVNDFAAVNLDAQLVARSRGSEDAQVVELSNGCVCCSSAAAAGFSEAVAQVLQECDVGKVQYLVVETKSMCCTRWASLTGCRSWRRLRSGWHGC